MKPSTMASALLMLVLVASITTAHADGIAEPMGVIQQLPATYPDHWMMIQDVSFFHMSEGEIVVVVEGNLTPPARERCDNSPRARRNRGEGNSRLPTSSSRKTCRSRRSGAGRHASLVLSQ